MIGAHGVIGATLVDHLLDAGWAVTGASRRGATPATDRPGLRHVAVDLLDAAGSMQTLATEVGTVTHVFHAAYQDRPSFAELVAPNVAMLRHTLDALEKHAPRLQHVSLMQGFKVYGAHLGPFKTPAREDDPRHLPPEFNVDQQDLVEARAAGSSWTWSAIRPSVVCSTTLGSPMNLAVVLGVYASICHELAVPFRFPGRPGAIDALLEMTDASLLAEATIWAATDPECADQALNITNGDLFRWGDMWPRIAAMFDLPVAPPLPLSLVEVMADKRPLWEAMAERHGLTASWDDVSSWEFGDFVLAWEHDVLSDSSKSRRLGFHHYVETEAMFARAFAQLRADHVIP